MRIGRAFIAPVSLVPLSAGAPACGQDSKEQARAIAGGTLPTIVVAQ